MLRVLDLAFDYQDQALLQGVNLQVQAGGLVHLRGANGVGKTTLLQLLAGLLFPQHGAIEFHGQNIHANLSAYQKQICFVGHKSGLNPYLTLRENCIFDMHFDESSTNLEELASLFALNKQMDKLCGILSAGQKRQASLLRLSMTKASFWILDEPFVALDQCAVQKLMQCIEDKRKEGGSVILSSHQALPWDRSDYQEYAL